MAQPRASVCGIAGCARPHHALGMCSTHYGQRYLLTAQAGVCSAGDCSRPVLAKALCGLHYSRVRLTGSPHRRRLTPDERFWPKVDRGGACWLWTGALYVNGYGAFRGPDGRTIRAHRFAYERVVGPIPEGLDLDHLCRVRACVNPAHLEPVTRAENLRRARQVTR